MSVLMSDALIQDAIITLDSSLDKRTIIEALIDHLISIETLQEKDRKKIIDIVLEREERGSTGIGNGIAIPHCRTDLVSEICAMYAYTEEGLEFDSLDGALVKSVFFILTPPELKDEHLQLMRNFATMIRKENFCTFLADIKDFTSLLKLIKEFEDAA